MFFTAHTAAGAALAAPLRRPSSAFVLGVASHIAMDWVPHWGTFDSELFLRAAQVDGLASLVLAPTLLVVAPKGRRVVIAAGMFGAMLPDLDKPAKHLLGTHIFPLPVRQFLGSIQTESPHLLTAELVAIAGLSAVALAGCVWQRRRHRRGVFTGRTGAGRGRLRHAGPRG